MKGYNENGLSILNDRRAISFGVTFDSQGNNTKGSTGKFECHGNIMSLLYGDDFEDKATIPSVYCFFLLFYSSEGLLTTPELPATTLVNGCYGRMFEGCTNLNHITMLATDIPYDSCLEYWVDNVSSTGTFVKHPNMESLPTGCNGIPEGWTVIDYDVD